VTLFYAPHKYSYLLTYLLTLRHVNLNSFIIIIITVRSGNSRHGDFSCTVHTPATASLLRHALLRQSYIALSLLYCIVLIVVPIQPLAAIPNKSFVKLQCLQKIDKNQALEFRNRMPSCRLKFQGRLLFSNRKKLLMSSNSSLTRNDLKH